MQGRTCDHYATNSPSSYLIRGVNPASIRAGGLSGGRHPRSSGSARTLINDACTGFVSRLAGDACPVVGWLA